MLRKLKGSNTGVAAAGTVDKLNTSETLVKNKKRTRATQTHTNLPSVPSVSALRLNKKLKPMPTTINNIGNSVNTLKKIINTSNTTVNTVNTINNNKTKATSVSGEVEGVVLRRINSIINKSRFKRLCREYVGDFWSRVDSNEIPIQSLLHSYTNTNTMDSVDSSGEGATTISAAPKDNMNQVSTSSVTENSEIENISIITMSVSDYSYKSTPFGDVYYSPRFQDDKYIYRYVILTKGVRNEAYRLLKQSKSYLLTEHQIIRELCIDLSPGWEHFMLFKNRLDELILRRKL